MTTAGNSCRERAFLRHEERIPHPTEPDLPPANPVGLAGDFRDFRPDQGASRIQRCHRTGSGRFPFPLDLPACWWSKHNAARYHRHGPVAVSYPVLKNFSYPHTERARRNWRALSSPMPKS